MNILRRIAASFSVMVLLLVGFAAPSHADTALCNSTGGAYCGEVVNNSTSARSIIVANHDGRTAYVYPGQGSKAAGIRDVAKFWRPSGYVTREWFAGVYKGCFSGGSWRTGIEDNVENWNVEVRRFC